MGCAVTTQGRDRETGQRAVLLGSCTALASYGSEACLARIIHASLYSDRQLHAISNRTRASRLNIPAGMPASLMAAYGSI